MRAKNRIRQQSWPPKKCGRRERTTPALPFFLNCHQVWAQMLNYGTSQPLAQSAKPKMALCCPWGLGPGLFTTEFFGVSQKCANKNVPPPSLPHSPSLEALTREGHGATSVSLIGGQQSSINWLHAWRTCEWSHQPVINAVYMVDMQARQEPDGVSIYKIQHADHTPRDRQTEKVGKRLH